jgi:Protein of unknown function (DUF2934)
LANNSLQRKAQAFGWRVCCLFINQEFILTHRVGKECSIMARSKSRTGSKTSNDAEATPVAPANAVLAPETAGGENGKSKTRPRIVKSAARPSMVPFSLEEEIRRRAYELYEQRGPSSGSETDDWLIAEREILERYQEHRA